MMQFLIRRGALLVLALSALLPLTAHAGRNCEAVAPDAAKTQKGIRFATQVRESLELSGASVVMLGRVGSDQSKRGVRYTHVAYVLRDHPAGPWTVVHQLNNCGSGDSDLYDEGLANFFMDDPFAYDSRIVIPSPALQEKLARTLLGPMKRGLHEPSYSSIANPWSIKHQNSNGWALEILAAASAPADVYGRAQAQQWLRMNNYQPSRIAIGGGERAGARLFTPHIRFGDHPDTAWQTQTYEVSTGDAVLSFLRQIDPEARVITQRLDARPVVGDAPTRHNVEVRAAPSAAVAEPARSVAPAAPVAPVAIAPSPPAANSQSRAQILQSMQGLIVSYACRPQGYLNQCRQMERSNCEKMVSDSVLRCFATVSDQQLMNGTEQSAMLQMQEVGYCAVEAVDASLGPSGKRQQTLQGQSCQSVRSYK